MKIIIAMSVASTLSAFALSAEAHTIRAKERRLEDPRPPFRIVHLGDSYSAGNGARNALGDEDWHSVSGCYRSPSNWGSRFARSLTDVFAVTYINRACSGGVLANIINERKLGSVFNVLGDCPDPDFPDEEILRDEGLLTCTRYLQPQIKAIDTSVDLVLITIGGNDAGFDNIVKQCFTLGFLDPVDCKDAVDYANGVLTNSYEANLIDTFAEIRSRLKPEARVVLVSYPHLLLDVPYVIENFFDDVTYDAGTAIRALANRADQIQQAAVAAANLAAGEDYIVYYDNTKTLFNTHEPNPSTEVKNPERWINEFFEGALKEWYHPNPLGHENWGRALSILETFGAVGGSFGTAANIDLVFIVDTTGSMGGEIAEVRVNLAALVGQLAAATSSYRVAVVSYRDFPELTGNSNDYPSRVDQTFTSSLADIQAAIDSLVASGGGDFPETVFSAINAATELPWRPGVTKIAIVIGDAPALVQGGAEPISGLTASEVVARSIAVDPVQVIAVNVGSLVDANLQTIVDGTGGSVLSGTGSLTGALSNIINSTAQQPFAWFGSAVAGKTGVPIVFDAQGSFDPQGNPITLFEWDFDGDGTFDLKTTSPTAEKTYDTAFEGFVILRVTSNGGTALASARTVVNELGYVSQGNEEPCKLDVDGFSIILDINGSFLNCNATNLPTANKPGVREVTSVTPVEAVLCDFSTLIPGIPLTNQDQADKLRNNCSMSVIASGTKPGTVYSNPPINVFDSLNGVLSKYPRDDPDLGAPNRACGPIVNGQRGPGRGRGGKPLIRVNGTMVDNPYKNCAPLGNLLIIQNGDISVEEKANDSPYGGCMEFEFNGLHVTLTDFGLLDLEETVEVTLYLDGVQVGPMLTSPVTGDNGYWVASTSYGEDVLPSPVIDSMSICSFHSGAVSFINFSSIVE